MARLLLVREAVRTSHLYFAALLVGVACGRTGVTSPESPSPSSPPPPGQERDGADGCSECIGTEVGWEYLGGWSPAAFTLGPCRTFHMQFNVGAPSSCTAELAQCVPAGARIEALLDDPSVTAALGAHTFFGEDTTAVDGATTRISTGSGWFDIGACPTAAECRPAAVVELQELLRELDRSRPCTP